MFVFLSKMKNVHTNTERQVRVCVLIPPLSCLGQIPLAGVSLLWTSSSLPGVTCTPTSTGIRGGPLPISRAWPRGEMGMLAAPPASPGLTEKEPGAPCGGPRHRRRLCSMKTRMSPRGKLVWHWPHVSRSCSSGPRREAAGAGDGDLAVVSLPSAAGGRRQCVYIQRRGKDDCKKKNPKKVTKVVAVCI